MKSLMSGLFVLSLACLTGCSHVANARYSKGIPGFPPGHDLSVHKSAHA